jgi:1-acyl-sn-glycerol-3-phosphate acyltransferase
MTLSYWLGHCFFKLAARSLFNYRVINPERLEVPGAALVICNHASFLDPPFIGVAFEDSIHYFAKKPLFKHPMVAAVLRSWNAIPVDQDRPDMGSVKAVIRLLTQQKKVLIFPEGSRSEDGVMTRGEPGTGLIVAKTGVPVIPMRIFGTYEALPRGVHFLQPSEITVVVGNTWHYDPAAYTETGKELYQKITDDLIAQVSDLRL